MVGAVQSERSGEVDGPVQSHSKSNGNGTAQHSHQSSVFPSYGIVTPSGRNERPGTLAGTLAEF